MFATRTSSERASSPWSKAFTMSLSRPLRAACARASRMNWRNCASIHSRAARPRRNGRPGRSTGGATINCSSWWYLRRHPGRSCAGMPMRLKMSLSIKSPVSRRMATSPRSRHVCNRVWMTGANSSPIPAWVSPLGRNAALIASRACRCTAPSCATSVPPSSSGAISSISADDTSLCRSSANASGSRQVMSCPAGPKSSQKWLPNVCSARCSKFGRSHTMAGRCPTRGNAPRMTGMSWRSRGRRSNGLSSMAISGAAPRPRRGRQHAQQRGCCRRPHTSAHAPACRHRCRRPDR